MILKNWKYYTLRIVFALILVGSLSYIITSALYWIWKVAFNTDFGDTTAFNLLLFYFGMAFWSIYSIRATVDRGSIRLENWVDSKLKRYELRTRYVFRLFLFRIGLVTFMGTILYWFAAGLLAGEKHTFAIDLFFVSLVLIGFSLLLISDKDIALLSFRKFRDDKTKNFEDLRHALKTYNKTTNLPFSTKELSEIAQYVTYAYNLNLEECKSIDTSLNEIIKLIENKQDEQIPKILVQLSADCDSFIKKYSSIGIEIKPSLWIRVKETVSSALLKILPQVFWLLIIIAIYLIIRTFVPIEFPSLG